MDGKANMIELRNVTKKFGDVTAVDHVDLEIAPGELFAFIGPNGAGKTTTIKLLAGLLRPDEGRIRVCGFDVQKEHLKSKSLLSYVPDQPFLYDKLTGREFLHFVGGMYGIPRKVIRSEIEKLAEMFDFNDYVDNLAETYSHGMKQRIVLSSALLHGPKVIVVDEPMVGLDPKSANLLKQILVSHAERGNAVFMSTHTLAIAEETATRVGIINKGRIIALGNLEEIYAKAQSDRRLEEAFLRLTEESAQ